MSFNDVKGSIVLNITLNILIINSLSYFINKNYVTPDSELKTTIAPLYGTGIIFLVLCYVALGELNLDKPYESFINTLSHINLLVTCFLLWFVMHPFGSYKLFISGISVLIIFSCYIIPTLILAIFLIILGKFIKRKCTGVTQC
jgi:hypothetical protein